MIARRFVAAAALAWLGLGCIDVGTIPAPGPAPGSGAPLLQWRKLGEPTEPSGGAMVPQWRVPKSCMSNRQLNRGGLASLPR